MSARQGRYVHLAALASGGMGRVTIARNADSTADASQLVAIKTLHPHLRNDAEAVERFAREAEVSTLVDHPNVIRVIERGEDGGQPFLAMEYFASETLAAVLTRASRRKTRVPLRVALRIVTDALAGLHAVHEARDAAGQPMGIVHRDFSPQNVLVGESGITKLADLGIAKGARSAALTRVGAIRGKTGYLSPEQTLGRKLDRRSDVFSAGIVLHELVTTRPLFHAETESAALDKLLKGVVPDPRVHTPDCPPALAEVILRALDRDPARRPSTAEAFRAELVAIAETLPQAADAPAVAGFLADQLGDRLAVRRKAIERAMAHPEPGVAGIAPANGTNQHDDSDDSDSDSDSDSEGSGTDTSESLALGVRPTLWIAAAIAVLLGLGLSWWLMR